MPIYKGSQQIKHIYYGVTKILTVYNGSTRVYPEGDGCYVWNGIGRVFSDGGTQGVSNIPMSFPGQINMSPTFNWDYTRFPGVTAPSGTYIESDGNGCLCFRIPAATSGTWRVNGSSEVQCNTDYTYLPAGTVVTNANSPYLVHDSFWSRGGPIMDGLFLALDWSGDIVKPANTVDAYGKATDWRIYPYWVWYKNMPASTIIFGGVTVGIKRLA